MSFDLKVSFKQRSEPSAQQKKLNQLIAQIEQQKISLATWKNAQDEIQQHTRQKLMPLYRELHEVLFLQLEQLWHLLQSHTFSKNDLQQLDEKIAQLARMLKRSQLLNEEQLTLVQQIDTFYQQHSQQSVKKLKKVQSEKFEYQASSEPSIEQHAEQRSEQEDDFEQYAADQQQAREKAKQLRQQQKREQAEQLAAQSLKTFARRRRGHRKLKIDSILWKFIVEAIRCLWSPQQIAKRLKTFPDLDQTMNVSHTTIYSTIRALPKGELKKDLLSCLRHENKKRKANGEPKKDSILQDIKTIHERPAEVQERKIPGHWEADLIKGKDNKSSIATLIERNTRLCILATLPDAKAESVRKALTEALKYLPAELRKTLTYDRGREMSEHKILEEDLGIDVYFCDPHSPWQKGTCENMNGLIRQYLPKGIDLNQADQHYLNQVAMSLNTRPRKALDWLTPLEKFAQLVDYHKAFETVAPHV